MCQEGEVHDIQRNFIGRTSIQGDQVNFPWEQKIKLRPGKNKGELGEGEEWSRRKDHSRKGWDERE